MTATEIISNNRIEIAKRVIRANPELAASMVIKGWELKVYNAIKLGTQTSRHVSLNYSISIHHASIILNKLMQKEYLSRVSVLQSSGGYEWEYTAII